MKLLTKEELIWSPVVANNAMNRERGVTGVNSYCKELKFNCLQFLEERVIFAHEPVRWVDLCCGKGRALTDAHRYFQKKTMQSLELEGWDLIDSFHDYDLDFPKVTWHVGSLEDWTSDYRYDLITCVHGLHYVGDKLSVIEKCVRSLTDDGVFIANIDFGNVKSLKDKQLKRKVIKICRDHGLTYNPKIKVLRCEGKKDLRFNLAYQGADDQAGPNYTGQPVVDSYYAS
ncbi:MAG: class I SAM-dependent methyltransferase [Flammeovirgaceae bacterium]